MYADPEYSATPTFRFNGHYTAALAACGALPLVIPLNLPEDVLRDIFERLDGLCLAGGVDVDPGIMARHITRSSVRWTRRATAPNYARPLGAGGGPAHPRHLPWHPAAQRGRRRQAVPGHPGAGARGDRHNYQVPDSAWETPRTG